MNSSMLSREILYGVEGRAMSLRSSWAHTTMDYWKIVLVNREEQQHIIDHIMRCWLLHTVMSLKKKSSLAPYLPIRIKAIKWTGIEITRDAVRHRYNPSFSNESIIIRNDCIWNLNYSPSFYEFATFTIDPRTNLPIIGVPSRLEFVDAYENPLQIANSRNSTTKYAPIFEDLRFPTTRENIVDQLNLVTGISIDMSGGYVKSETCIFEYISKSKMKWICNIKSPLHLKQEKNWLFVQSQEIGVYSVLYNWYDGLTIYNYNHLKRTMSGKNVININEPVEWQTYTNNDQSEYRLSAAGFVDDDTQLMVILHKKDFQTFLYSYYCIYLDTETFRPIAYIPTPIFTDVAIRILFVMNIYIDKKYIHVSTGVSDEIGGIISYSAVDWNNLKKTYYEYEK